MMKRIISVIMALSIMLAVLVSCSGKNNSDADKNGVSGGNQKPDGSEEKVDYTKTIDIYLIAGQSNAAGSTLINDDMSLYKDVRETLDGGFTHVHYSGRSYGVPTDKSNWTKTTSGQGITNRHIGPELGLAKYLSKYYNGETGRHAGIIKFAHGGSNLLNYTAGSGNQYGNWLPPSYAEELGLSYKDSEITGGLYRKFLKQFKTSIEGIEAYSGHTKINIVGLYWMQGESDRGNPNLYARVFKMFVKDLKKDLSNITLEFTNGESDCGVSDMAILVGAISQTFSISNANTASQVNVPFINMQKDLVRFIPNCYFVDNSQFAITKWNQSTGKVEVVGSDSAHWNQNDMIQIGKNVGKTFVEHIKNKGKGK